MDSIVHDAERLKELQALDLNRKIMITQTRIIEWYEHYNGQVCVSFSGGKDSTVLLHIARKLYPNIPAVFSNTGLEYPEIQKFVRSLENVDVVVPSLKFTDVITKYGYPLIGKEVAEAIYYARRIRSQSVQVEREDGQQFSIIAGSSWGSGQPYQDRRSEKQKDNSARALGRETKFKRVEISGARRVGIARSGQIVQGGVFSNAVERFGGKSQFNKEKYLPLVYTPIPISHYCCFKIKKSPLKKYQHEHGYFPIIATLAEESRVRKQGWIRHGCNAFDGSNPISQPMSFWTEQDVLTYIVRYGLETASVYGDVVSRGTDGNDYSPIDLCGNIQPNLHCTGCERTGCIFCAFGFHLEKGETRFQRLAKTHPRQYEYSIGGGQWIDNPAYDPAAPKMDGEWENWNPKKIWIPSKQGLGLGKVFDMVNEIYGKDFYRYE